MITSAVDVDALEAIERQIVVARAWAWVGTPFQHGARLRGIGVDCIQLLAAVYQEAEVLDLSTEPPPHYSPDWFLHRDDELLLGQLRQYCEPYVDGPPAPGDIVTFRFGRQVSHAGVTVAHQQMIHALGGRAVSLEEYGPHSAFAPRFAGVWRLKRWAA